MGIHVFRARRVLVPTGGVLNDGCPGLLGLLPSPRAPNSTQPLRGHYLLLVEQHLSHSVLEVPLHALSAAKHLQRRGDLGNPVTQVRHAHAVT